MPPTTTPTLLSSTSRLPWLPAASLANRRVREPGDKQFWRVGFDQPSRLRCWIYQGFVSFLLLFFWGGVKLAVWIYTKKKKKMSSKSEIFDKCPAWFITMSVWSTACFVSSLLSLLLFSVHGAQSLRWAISALLNVIFVISVSFWTKFCCTSIYNSSKENHLVLLTQHLLPSCEAHSHRGVL